MCEQLEEIKAILKETNKTLAETVKRSKHNEIMFEKFREESEARAKEQQKKWEQEQKESEARAKEQQKEWEQEQKEWKEKRKEMEKKMDSYGAGVGLQAETFFMEATKNGVILDGVTFDKFAENYVILDPEDKKQEHKAELDIIFENGKYTFVLEIKYRLDKKHMAQYLEKIARVKRLEPQLLGDKKIVLGFAILGVKADVRDYFTEAGFYIFTQKNDKLNIYGDGINREIEGF